MLPGLVIWNETTHIKKHGLRVQTVWCVHGYHIALGELHALEREAKNTVGTYTVAVKTDDLLDTEWRIVTRLPTDCLLQNSCAVKTMYKYVLTIMIICVKYFFFCLFVIFFVFMV